MRLKAKICNNVHYDIIDDVSIILSQHSNFNPIKTIVHLEEGRYSITASYFKSRLENISLFLPEYSSQMYSPNTILSEYNLKNTQLLLTSNKLTCPLGLKNKYMELFDNGFFIRTSNVSIHPAYFFNKIIGLLFNIEY